MARQWTCPLCKQTIRGVHSITRHESNLSKRATDVTRCDNVTHTQRQQDPAVHEPLPDIVEPDPVPDIVEPEPVPDLTHITRRLSANVPSPAYLISERNVERCSTSAPTNPIDISRVQFEWSRYCAKAQALFAPAFWKFFLPMNHLSRKAIDTALSSAKHTFLVGDKFPTSTRYLYEQIQQIETFWPNVMHSVTIDLSSFKKLPPNKRTLTFGFIDPLWAWVLAACKQPAHEMQWKPKVLSTVSYPNHPCYGGGVQFGDSFAEAYRTCPAGTLPMCVALHWDGTRAHGLDATPICVGVCNTNSLSADTQYCIGYMPVVHDMGGAHACNATEIKFAIRQQCIAAILRVLENGAKQGVRCRLPSQRTPDKLEEVTLMTRLLSMNMDQPEAQLYFGLLNKTYVIWTIHIHTEYTCTDFIYRAIGNSTYGHTQ